MLIDFHLLKSQVPFGWKINPITLETLTQSAVGSHLCQSFSFFLPFYSDKLEKTGEERLKKNLFNDSPDPFSIFCHLKRLTLTDGEIKRKHASTCL